jgi:2-dehydropantoate 2-reductase
MKNTPRKTHICLVGNGRLASQLKSYLQQKSVTFTQITRKTSTAEQIAASIHGATHIWLAISDHSIETFYQAHSKKSDAIWVHFSGAHNSKWVFAAHPLMTFSHRLMSAEDFDKIHFVVSSPLDKPLDFDLSLEHLLPSLKNSFSLISAEKKPLYHALCVVAGNFPIILWSEVLAQFNGLALPQEALHNYLDRSLENFKIEGAHALTGPLVRKDLQTIKDNLNALEGQPLQPIYESFVKSKGIIL